MNKLVLEVALEYKRAMRLAGRNFSFPIANDVSKTYSYRSIASFVDKCKRVHHFDDDMIKETVHAVVQHARVNKLLKAGAAILTRSDVIEICCDSMRKQLKDSAYLAEQFMAMNKEINSKSTDRTAYFRQRAKRAGYPNLIMLRANNEITDSFICFSKSAITVMGELPQAERAVLLPVRDYMKLRVRLLSKLELPTLAAAFGDDLNVKI